MTFKISVDNPKVLLDFAQIINVLADEATLNLSEEGISVRLMDQSRVAMINLVYPKTLFTEYKVDATQKLCVNMIELLKLLKRAGKNDKATLETVADGKLQLTFNGPWQRQWTIPTLETSSEDIPVPQITFNVKASLVTHALTQSIEDAQLVSDHMFINADTETLQFTASGDLMNADIKMEKGNDGLLALETKTPAKSCYSLSYLVEIVKAGAQISDIVNLEYTTDMPVKLDFVTQEATVQFFLAPRLGDD
jgi:proliferating cell nuclear antigen